MSSKLVKSDSERNEEGASSEITEYDVEMLPINHGESKITIENDTARSIAEEVPKQPESEGMVGSPKLPPRKQKEDRKGGTAKYEWWHPNSAYDDATLRYWRTWKF